MKKYLQDALSNLSAPSYSKPKFLEKQSEIIEKKYDSPPLSPEPADLDKLLIKVRKLWRDKGLIGFEALKSKEIRLLPWIMFHGNSPKIIEDKLILLDILRLMEEKWKVIYNSLIHAYLKFYEPGDNGVEELRKFLHQQLVTYKGNNYSVNKWKNRTILFFTPNGPAMTANWLMNQQNSVNESLKKLDLTGNMGQSSFLKYTITEVIENIKRQNLNKLDILLSLLEVKQEYANNYQLYSSMPGTPILTRARFPELIAETANHLLPIAGTNVSTEVQDRLRPFFLKRLNDPRLPGGATRWSKVSKEALAVFKQWLSRKDLEFFFNIVDKSSDDPKWMYRRKFWEAYIPFIENTWVALSKRARDMFNEPGMKSDLKDLNYGRFRGAQGQSIFLIEMGGHVFVEWSHSGACRIWEKNRFPLKFGVKEYSASQITGINPDYWQDHRGSEFYRWQDRLANWFKYDLGIKQVTSYFLE